MSEHPVDPATEAVSYHLAELKRLVEAATEEPVRSRASQATARVLGRDATPRPSSIDDHLIEAITALGDRVERLAQWQQGDHEAVGNLDAATLANAQRLDLTEEAIRRLDSAAATAIPALDARIDDADARIRELQSLRDMFVRATTGSTTAPTPAADPDSSATTPDESALPPDVAQELQRASLDGFYRDLEAHFRGTRDHVTGLMQVYIEDVLAVGGPVLDIGCGRGEWLELLGTHDVEAYGVDLNDTFAQENRERGLDVRTGDAIAHLATLPDASLGVITGFHLAEHLPFEVLVDLADQALRALRPGGIMILESPDPTNVRVGAAQFWIDPTHIRPLHPELLRFVMLQRGFRTSEIRPLHPAMYYDLDWAAALGDHATDQGRAMLAEIREALCGPMDYAVIATRGEN